MLGVQNLRVVVDSINLAREICGQRRVLSPSLQPLHTRILALTQSFAGFSVLVSADKDKDKAGDHPHEARQVLHPAAASPSSSSSSLSPPEPQRREEEERPSPSPAPATPAVDFLMRFDGGSRGNPGPSGAGVVIYRATGPVGSGTGSGGKSGWEEVYAGALWLGGGLTNNEAEYRGLIGGLEAAAKLGIKVSNLGC